MFISAFIRRGFGGRNRHTPNVPPPPAEINTPPTAPSGLTVTATLSTSVSLSWTGSVSTDALNVLGYKVYVNGFLTTTTTGTSITVSPLIPSTNYSFRVKSYTSALDSAYSSSVATTTTADTSPDEFTFASITGAALATVIPSGETVTITGLSGSALLRLTGSATPQWNKNGTGWNSGDSVIADSDTLQVRQTSSGLPNTPVVCIVQVGTYTTGFTVTTGAGVQVPDDFDFTDQTEVAQSTQVYSGFESITGIDVTVPVTVTNGEWAKNGSTAYSSTAGTVVNNDTVAVRHTSSSAVNTTVTTTLNVGLGSATFNSTTIQSAEPDYTPDDFPVPWVTGAATNTVVESGPYAIAGITVPVTVTVGGAGSPEWTKIIGGSPGTKEPWSSAPGTIENGDDFFIRATSSNIGYDARVAGATIGTLGLNYTVVTAPPNQDITPDDFTFADQTEVALSTLTTSASANITGIDTPVLVTVVNGEWDKNTDGNWSQLPGVVSSGDTVQVRHTSSASNNTNTVTTLTVGLKSATFTSVTVQDVGPDNTPDAISDQAITDVDINTLQTFSPVTVTGIDSTVSVSIAGGGSPQVSIAGGGYVSSGTVAVGESMVVRMTAPAAYASSNAATLTVGTISVTFSVYTSAADTTPDAFAFTPTFNESIGDNSNSDVAIITGINAPSPAVVTSSAGDGKWRIASPPERAFPLTASPGTVINGDGVQVWHQSGLTGLETKSTTLTIGGVSATFFSTTVADTVAPSAPVLLSVDAVGADGWQLTWNASSDNVGVTGYRAYGDTGSGPVQFYDGALFQAVQTGIPPSTSTTYTVRAYDAAGNLSSASNAVVRVTAPSSNPNRTVTGDIVMDSVVSASTIVVVGGGGGGTFAVTGFAGNNPALPNVINHNQPSVISGAVFGTKSPAAPLVWDDCSGTNPLTLWDGVAPDSGSGLLTYRAPQRNVALVHDRVGKYLCGSHVGGENDVYCWRGGPRLDDYTYASWYQTYDPLWPSYGDNNLKTYVYTAYSGASRPYLLPYWYINYESASSIPLQNYAKWVTDGSLSNPDENGHNIFWVQSACDRFAQWSRVEVMAKHTEQNGQGGYVDQQETIPGVHTNDVIYYNGRSNSWGGTHRTQGIGGYARANDSGSASNAWRYFADLYVDNTLARVILCNNSNYNAATIREPQIPTAWSASSITVTGNLGKFTAGATAYLFVIDAAGSVSNGFSVTVGS